MKTALCLFFNYPFERNIPVLEELYAGTFDSIVHIQPMLCSERKNVNTVYRAAFNFGGFFSDSRSFLEALDADYYIFAGDDCIINTRLFHENFEKTFLKENKQISAFIPQLLKFSNGNEWKSPHKINTLARFVNGYGLYDQRIEDWNNFLPDPQIIKEAAKRLGVYSETLHQPSEEDVHRLTPGQREVLNRLMGNKLEAPLPYPLVYAVSDFFILSRQQLSLFCHNVGLLATMNAFPEVSVPTALLSLPGPISQAKDLHLKFEWTWGRNREVEHFVPTSIDEVRNFIAQMGENTLFRHPIKLSKVKMK
jgi:hypothetical protein